MIKDLQRLVTILCTSSKDALSWAAWAADESFLTLLHWIVLTIESCLWKSVHCVTASLWNGFALQCLIFLYHLSPVVWVILPEVIVRASFFTCVGLQRLFQVGLFFGWLVFLSTISVSFQLLFHLFAKMLLLWLIFPWMIISGSIRYMKRKTEQSLQSIFFM